MKMDGSAHCLRTTSRKPEPGVFQLNVNIGIIGDHDYRLGVVFGSRAREPMRRPERRQGAGAAKFVGGKREMSGKVEALKAEIGRASCRERVLQVV